jgi:hypothetical protein
MKVDVLLYSEYARLLLPTCLPGTARLDAALLEFNGYA